MYFGELNLYNRQDIKENSEKEIVNKYETKSKFFCMKTCIYINLNPFIKKTAVLFI